MCDVAYVLRRDQFERHALADRQALIASGRVDDLGRLPSIEDQLDQWDRWLQAKPERGRQLSTDHLEMLRALGVA